jgi:hypothetical protein
MNQSKFVGSGKRFPCPVCSRADSDKCRIGDEGKLILCGTEVNSRKPKDTLGNFLYLGESENGVWGKWVPISEEWEKNRPQNIEFRYPFFDRAGNKIVDEVRVYDAQGRKKSWMDPKGVNTAVLLPYRYTEAIAALENGAPFCLILEGPPKADVAFELGLPAVAFANSFKASRDSHWFEGYEDRLVLVPDQDTVGLEKVAKMKVAYPMAQQWRPWPDSAWWQPEWIFSGGGKDFKDWVEQLRASGHDDGVIAAMIMPMGHKPVDAGEFGPLVGTEDGNKSLSNESNDDFDELGLKRIDLKSGKVESMGREVISYLAKEQDPWQKIYYQGGANEHRLVRILSTNGTSDIISGLDLDRFQCVINEKMIFETKNTKGSTFFPCPVSVAKHVFSKDRWPDLQRLNLISRIPVLTKEGKVLDTPGYHEKEAALLDFNPDDFDIKAIPTKDDAIESLSLLLDLFKECCFGSPLDKACAIGMVLTAFSRNLYESAPMFATSANAAGAGKGTISAIVSLLLTGRPSSGLTQFIPDEVEFAKQLVSSLLEAPPIVNFDNVKENVVFGGATIESLLTTDTLKKRVLGVSKDVNLSTRLLWTVNGNNLRLTTDMIRRTILINLVSQEENPQERVFERKDIFDYVSKNRRKYISAALTVLKAFILTNPPFTNVSPLNSFVQWDGIVRQCLLWLGQPDIVQSQKTLQEDDESKETFRVFLLAWREKYGSAKQSLSDVIKRASNDDAFRAAIAPYAEDKHGKLSVRAFGRNIRAHKNAIVSGMQLKRSETMSNGSYDWKVEPTVVDQAVDKSNLVKA